MIPVNTLYLAAVAGAVALVFLLRPGRRTIRLAAAVVAIAAVGAMLAAGLEKLTPKEPGRAVPLVFGAIAIIAAVRMITLSRPVLAALHFVLVVVASAGMFLLLQAEFMAFALVIVYAGAILITYLFVLMLARQSPDDASEGPYDYDALPREPLAACLVGLLMVASTSGAIVADAESIRAAATSPQVAAESVRRGLLDLQAMPRLLDEMAEERFPGSTGVARDDRGRPKMLFGPPEELVQTATVTVEFPGGEPPVEWVLGAAEVPGNTRLVGMRLVAGFPVSLELAGVILLMAMYGAVVLARRQVELGEDERREAAGLRPLSVDEPETSGGAR